MDNNSFDFGSKGGSHIIELLSNDRWTVEIENGATWLTLSETSGSGSATLTLTAADNPSVNLRSTTVVINRANSQGVRIRVSQQSRYLRLSAQNITFFGNGGISQPVIVETDGRYEVTGDAQWFTIARSDGQFTVSAAENVSNEFRRGKITVRLTDLTEGTLALELAVLQSGKGGTFIKNGYSEDGIWDKTGDGSLTLTVGGYTSDNNWDAGRDCRLNVKVTGYSEDADWNRKEAGSCRVSINRYGADKDWNKTGVSTGSFGLGNHGADSDWNGSQSSDGSFGHGSHGADNDWNDRKTSSGAFSGSNYGADNDWNYKEE